MQELLVDSESISQLEPFDMTNLLPCSSDWLRTVSRQPVLRNLESYVPQCGDRVVYFYSGHQAFASANTEILEPFERYHSTHTEHATVGRLVASPLSPAVRAELMSSGFTPFCLECIVVGMC